MKTLLSPQLSRMILYRPVVVLQFRNLSPLSSTSKFLSQSRHSYSFLSRSVSPSSSSSSSLRICWFWLIKPRHIQCRAFGTAVTTAFNDGVGSDTFYAEDSVSWSSLGVSDKVSRALFNAGFGQPSLVQAATIPSIFTGKDVVVAAETGSGKTHSYLVPVIDRLCNGKVDSGNIAPEQAESPSHKLTLVLCPNVTLCEQVVRMANGLCDDNGQPLLVAAAVCGRQGWPVNKPDIVVTTPAALLNNIDPHKRRQMAFLRGVKYVVFDEADMLLCGGFQNKVIRLIHLLRYDEKKLSWSKESTPKLPMHLVFDKSSEHNSEDDEDSTTGIISDEEETFEDDVDDLPEEVDAGPAKMTEWRRVRKDYERSKQYIFIAATLPVNGKKTAGAVLKKMFPDANWVSGNYLHRHNPRLKQKWIEVSVDSQVDELLRAVNEGSNIKSVEGGGQRTIVFANTVEAVEAVAKILLRAGIECYRYHKDCSLEERSKTLNDFQENGGILVCTDAAARGVDISNISHVIQADFATSAVDFLHRVGRTARAGQYGLVTSFYTESNRDLVAAVQSAGELGQSVETAFSRKRSFRNKLKKRGQTSLSKAWEVCHFQPDQ
ncbi:DEAD-box ATP-dependent RNA helicase 22 isoform X3 [Humulus lupulus]|uniref:DEAD-box ATP-dependent RNA helicase 22 isoform X3 n=1 Tax=Humulus lupulus TaxID=3486 RepID=UPI002B41819B|nr:DEAD-box ATP-dependent RNA helicase 22 isoform X3 [Humulus lupulus]